MELVLIYGTGCSSTTFDTCGIEYKQVCGKIIEYQDQTPDALSQGQSQPINGHYVEGINLTHGRNPRKHTWTFAAALHETGTIYQVYLCPCTNRNVAASTTPPPCFVRNDYFCDAGSTKQAQHIIMVMIHCGMEQVVGLLMTAVISITLVGF